MHLIKTYLYGYIIGDSIGFNMLYNKEINNRRIIKDNYKYTSNTVFMLSVMESIINRRKIDNRDIINKLCTTLIVNKYSVNGKILKINDSTFNVLNVYSKKTKMLNNELDECDPISRIIPIILYKRNIMDKDLLSHIISIVSLTHQNETAILGCYIYAKYCLNILNGSNKFQALNISIPDSFNIEVRKKYKKLLNKKIRYRKLNNTNDIVDTLNIVFYSIFHNKDYISSLNFVDNFNKYNNNYCAYIGFIASIIYKSKSIPQKYVKIIRNKEDIDVLIKKYERIIK